ncbi:MAG: SIMPL domain-containing protein [Candidatus Omnitrophota bacterium]
MKTKLLVTALIFLLTLIPVYSVCADEEENPRLISTRGEARIWINPDSARVFLGIETMSQNISAARDENARNIKKVMDALKSLKIKDMKTKAPSYNVSLVKEKEYDATRQGRLPNIIGYKVTQNFTVLLKNDDPKVLSNDAASVIDTALNNGVNIISEVMFFKQDDSDGKREALKLAVQNAISNAEAIATTAGVSIKDYTTISSSTSYMSPRSQMRQMMNVESDMGGGADTTLVAGQIAINVNVSLSCSIE